MASLLAQLGGWARLVSHSDLLSITFLTPLWGPHRGTTTCQNDYILDRCWVVQLFFFARCEQFSSSSMSPFLLLAAPTRKIMDSMLSVFLSSDWSCTNGQFHRVQLTPLCFNGFSSSGGPLVVIGHWLVWSLIDCCQTPQDTLSYPTWVFGTTGSEGHFFQHLQWSNSIITAILWDNLIFTSGEHSPWITTKKLAFCSFDSFWTFKL